MITYRGGMDNDTCLMTVNHEDVLQSMIVHDYI